jgi:hypothetical protein
MRFDRLHGSDIFCVHIFSFYACFVYLALFRVAAKHIFVKTNVFLDCLGDIMIVL